MFISSLRPQFAHYNAHKMQDASKLVFLLGCIFTLTIATNQAQGLLIYPNDGSSENETIQQRPLLISKDGMIEDEGSLKHTVREQVTMILSYTDEKVRSEVLFNHLFALETRLRQVTREHGILSAENKYLLKNVWAVRARCAIEDIEKRFTIPRVVLTNEEAKGAANDFEYTRRVREKRWKTIFHTYKGSWEIKEIITKIQSRNRNEDALTR